VLKVPLDTNQLANKPTSVELDESDLHMFQSAIFLPQLQDVCRSELHNSLTFWYQFTEVVLDAGH